MQFAYARQRCQPYYLHGSTVSFRLSRACIHVRRATAKKTGGYEGRRTRLAPPGKTLPSRSSSISAIVLAVRPCAIPNELLCCRSFAGNGNRRAVLVPQTIGRAHRVNTNEKLPQRSTPTRAATVSSAVLILTNQFHAVCLPRAARKGYVGQPKDTVRLMNIAAARPHWCARFPSLTR